MDSEAAAAAAAAGWPGTEPRDWIPEMRQTDGTLEPPSSLSPRCSRRTGGMVEIRYALLDSRRYPAMYLPYQLSLPLSLLLFLSLSFRCASLYLLPRSRTTLSPKL